MTETLPEAPYLTGHYNYSWSEVYQYTLKLVNSFPTRYQLVYHSISHEQMVIKVNYFDQVFETKDRQLLVVSKMDASPNMCLLSFEMKTVNGHDFSLAEMCRGWECLRKYAFYLKLFSGQQKQV